MSSILFNNLLKFVDLSCHAQNLFFTILNPKRLSGEHLT